MESGLKILLKILIALCFLISISFIAIYFFVELNPNLELNTAGHIVLLMLSFIPAYIGSFLVYRFFGCKQAGRSMRCILWVFFILYILLLLKLTEFDVIYGRNFKSIFRPGSYISQLYLQHSVNLVPFKTIVTYLTALFTHHFPIRVIFVNLIGNICAFIPFAFFMPLLVKNMNSWKRFIVCIILIALTIEIMQLIFMTGSCDIDDLILNVSGAWIAYAVFKIEKVQKLTKNLTMQNSF